MKFPVNYIPIEKELEPVGPYLKGRVLNAGCGERDITQLLKSWQAETVDNCDIQTSIPGAFLCDLASIPKPEQSYDAILCNAVLEHVPDAEVVMMEFHRLLAPNGYVVIAVPFLQPFHPTPYDFRRFTRTGIEQMAKKTGFDVLHIWPIHSFAQTAGWILWAYLEERRSRLGKILFWLPIYLATRFFQRAPKDQAYAANGFQAVMQKTPQY
jgi:SAM-dependent methyltransferase